MKRPEQMGYLNICINYRMISITSLTVVYLFLMHRHENSLAGRLVLSAGMLCACMLGNSLYKRMLLQESPMIWIKITVGLELFANGIFIFLSGGFSSPYLWYYVGCLFLMMTLERGMVLVIPGTVWCLLCGLVRGGLGWPKEFSYLELNVCIGIIIVTGGFYVLLRYVHRLDQIHEEQMALNQNLILEKEKTEQALKQITDLYDIYNLFAMTGPERIIEELAKFLQKTIAPKGFILAELDEREKVKRKISLQMDDSLFQKLFRKSTCILSSETDRLYVELEGKSYEVNRIGQDIRPFGILIRPEGRYMEKTRDQYTFYQRILEAVFRNMDIQEQLEKCIISEEQNRIASEIHDTVIQRLFALVCGIKVLEESIGDLHTAQARKQADLLKNSAEMIMKELRETIYGKQFEDHSGHAFVKKVRKYMAEIEKLCGAEITVNIDEKAAYMTTGQSIALYRTVCETVNNAIRHGKADKVEVSVLFKKEEIWVAVKDNGSGFTKEKTERLGGNGLKNIYRMVYLLNGRMAIKSKSGEGASICIHLPRGMNKEVLENDAHSG